MQILYPPSAPFRLHQITALDQDAPAISARSDGTFLVAYHSYDSTARAHDLLGTLIDPGDGTRLATDTALLSETTGWQTAPGLAQSGAYLAMTWVEAGASLTNTSDDQVALGLLPPTGLPTTTTVVSDGTAILSDPVIATLPRGGFALHWAAETSVQITQNGAAMNDQIAQMRFFNADGTPRGGVLALQDTYRNGVETGWTTTPIGAHHLAVLRHSTNGPEDFGTVTEDIIAQRITATGAIADARPLTLHSGAEGHSVTLQSAITLTDGRVVALVSDTAPDSTTAHSLHILNPDGTLDDPLLLTTQIVGTDALFSLAPLITGGFSLAAYGTDAIGTARITLREFDSAGSPTGDAILLATPIQPVRTLLSEANADGDTIVAWAQDEATGPHQDLFAVTLASHCIGQTLFGGRGGDRLIGTACSDVIEGTEGADLLDGGTGADTMQGGLGNDIYIVDSTQDRVLGEVAFSSGGGIDTIRAFVDFTQPENVELLRLGNLTDTTNLNGTGNDAPGTLVGNAGANVLTGRGGNDQINGNDGADTLIGNTGRDTVVGGAGGDTFVFTAIADSRAGRDTRDFINGFEHGADRIDLSLIDANRYLDGHQSWTFIGNAAFDGEGANSAGQLRFFTFGGGNYNIVEADLNGDSMANLQIFVNLTNTMSESDFIL